jgi:hypothetical protein
LTLPVTGLFQFKAHIGQGGLFVTIEPLMRACVMREVDFIVPKTDAKGRITYTKPICMEFAGSGEAELLGSQHNIVRHPDIPRAVFRYRWETRQAGQEFFGYVKNLSSDGSDGYSPM